MPSDSQLDCLYQLHVTEEPQEEQADHKRWQDFNGAGEVNEIQMVQKVVTFQTCQHFGFLMNVWQDDIVEHNQTG